MPWCRGAEILAPALILKPRVAGWGGICQEEGGPSQGCIRVLCPGDPLLTACASHRPALAGEECVSGHLCLSPCSPPPPRLLLGACEMRSV